MEWLQFLRTLIMLPKEPVSWVFITISLNSEACWIFDSHIKQQQHGQCFFPWIQEASFLVLHREGKNCPIGSDGCHTCRTVSHFFSRNSSYISLYGSFGFVSDIYGLILVGGIHRMTEEATNGHAWPQDTRAMGVISRAAFEVDDYWRIMEILHKRSV